MSELRDTLRAKLLATRKPATKEIEFLGETIELRQMTVGAVMASAAETEDSKQESLIKALIQFAYVPGTDEPLFEEADKDALMLQPWDKSFTDLMNAMTEMTSINFTDKKNDSSEISSSSQ